MKKLIIILALGLMCLQISAQESINEQEYVDLGLPSGTLWKSSNEKYYYTPDGAVQEFGMNLPKKEHYQELIDYCKWEYQDGGYVVVGPNGNKILLPLTGCLDENGTVIYYGEFGTHYFIGPCYALCFGIAGADILMLNEFDLKYYFSIRLVDNNQKD